LLLSPLLQEDVAPIAVGTAEFPPGGKSVPHRHDVAQECWYILAGRGTMTMDDEVEEIEPGMMVVARPGQMHAFTNTGSEPLKVLYIYSPSGDEKSLVDGSFR
jgi:mannose-6-phosphate isomerase-like protein (cupin superfamily)